LLFPKLNINGIGPKNIIKLLLKPVNKAAKNIISIPIKISVKPKKINLNGLKLEDCLVINDVCNSSHFMQDHE
jgi:hypothetical protein